MKQVLRFRLYLLALAAMPWSATGQNDDLYYDPDDPVSMAYVEYEAPSYPSDPGFRETLPSYSSEYDDYNYWDDQGYFYTSRIRRFHRPYGGFGYYDPVYTDLGFYDPWMMPGTSIYIGVGGFNDYWYWRRMNRWRMNNWMFMGGFNTFGMRMWMDPWSYNSWGAFRVYDPWFDPYWGGACFNRGWGPGWGWGNTYIVNNYYGNMWAGSSWYSGPGYWYGHHNGTVDVKPTNTYYGPRIGDARTGPVRQGPRDPEYTGGGIPRLRDLVGSDQRPREADPATGNNGGRVQPGAPVDRQPVPGVSPPEKGRTAPVEPRERRVDEGRDIPAKEQVDPRSRPESRDDAGQPRGTVSPPQPERRDPLGDRPRWNDTESPRPQVREERSREEYRDQYIRQRELDRKPQNPQTDPRREWPPSRTERRTEPRQPAPSRERTSPERRDQRSTPMPRERTSRSEDRQQMPSRSFDRPSRQSPSPGSFERSNSGRSGGGMSPSRSGGSSERSKSSSPGRSSRRGG